MLKQSLIVLLTCTSFVTTVSEPIFTSKLVAQELKSLIAQSSQLNITVRDLQEFTGVINSLAVTPDGQTLLVASGDGKITAIDLNQSTVIYTKTVINAPNDLAVSSDGQRFAAALGERIRVFNLSDGTETELLQGHTGKVTSLAISPNNKTLTSVSATDETIRVWDLDQGTLVSTLGENTGPVTTVAFSPDGKLFVTGAIGLDRTLKFWDAQTLQLLRTSPQQPGYIYDVAITPDGQKLAAAVRNQVKVWDLVSGRELLTLKKPRLDLNAIAISPDSRMVATANKEGTITLWNLTNGKLLTTLTGHIGWVTSVAFSPDGKYLFSGAEDKSVKLWQLYE